MALAKDTFMYVSDLVRRKSAIQLAPGKEYLVESRLIPVAKELGFTGAGAVDAYIRSIKQKPEGVDHEQIVDALTTNETSFFRDISPFQTLAQYVIPTLWEEGRRNIRIWSAACSTGQEPYSIAMTLFDVKNQPGFQIVATDLSKVVLAKARAGSYTQLEVNRGLPAQNMVRYFERDGRGWLVNNELKKYITFKEHNLMTPAPIGGPYDIVFIRNVLIYFDIDMKRQVLARVAQSMRPGGFLFLGAAETTMGTDPLWERIDLNRSAVYRLNGGR